MVKGFTSIFNLSKRHNTWSLITNQKITDVSSGFSDPVADSPLSKEEE